MRRNAWYDGFTFDDVLERVTIIGKCRTAGDEPGYMVRFEEGYNAGRPQKIARRFIHRSPAHAVRRRKRYGRLARLTRDDDDPRFVSWWRKALSRIIWR